MSTKITKECLFCQQPFEAELREHRRGFAKFCSRSHAARYNSTRYWKKNKPNVSCAYCSKPFYKNQSKQSKSKSGIFFCCREHKDFAQRIGGIKAIQPIHYGNGSGSYQEKALRELPNQCNRCSYDRFVRALLVHHVDHDRSHNELSNLEILCPTCHWEHRLGLVD